MKTATAVKLADIFAAPEKSAPKLTADDPRAARAAEIKRELTSMETELAQLESELKSEALTRFAEEESRGVVTKTVDYGCCRVTRQDRSRALTEQQAEQLRTLIGAQLAKSLLVPDTSARVRPAMVPALLQLLGDQASQYLDVATTYRACKTWIEQRGAIRPTLGTDKNELLDAISAQLLVSPSITYKGQ
jgi:hypothetical protein